MGIISRCCSKMGTRLRVISMLRVATVAKLIDGLGAYHLALKLSVKQPIRVI